MSKKTRQKARARANAALSNRGHAHSNSASAVASSRSHASAFAINSASALGSSKKRGNHFIFDSEDDSATEVSVIRKKHKKEKKRRASSHGCSILGALPREQDDNGDSPGNQHLFMKASSAAFPHSRATFFAAKARATYQPSRDPQSSSSSRSAQAYSVQILWLAKPPQQLSHSIPEWFLLCDSGATHHMFNHRMFLANIRDTHLEVSWGDSSSSRSLGLGSMIGVSYYSASINAATMPCIVSSGAEDAPLVPDCSRNLASVPRFSQQGHDVRMNEEHPGLLLRDTKIFVPFCFEAHTGYYLMPWYPPPAYASFVRLPDKLDVIDLNASVESGACVSRLSAAAHAGAA